MVHFALNCHVTPIGLVGLHHKYKQLRPIFDSSFRPEPKFSGINDWTTKDTEPPLHFAQSCSKHLVWLYNLRITYPDREIYLGGDDVSGASRHQKYHPNLVGMHSCVIADHLSCSTGMTFGDNTSPSNFEPIADARRQLAKHLWWAARYDFSRGKISAHYTVGGPANTGRSRTVHARGRRFDKFGSIG